MEPARVRGKSTRMPLAIGVLVLASVVGVGVGPHLFESGTPSSPIPRAAEPSAGGVFSMVTVPSPAIPTATQVPTYPSTADRSTEFWVEILRKRRVLRRVPLVRRPDGSQTGTIPIPSAWRTQHPIIALFGRTVPTDPVSQLFSIRLALPDTPRLGPALNLAGGIASILDPVPKPIGSFGPGPLIGYIHTWSYSANLKWAVAGGPELVVTVAPQLGVY